MTTFTRTAGVEPESLPGVSAPPAVPPRSDLPWACATCGGWVNPIERVYTDEGLYHDRLSCLTEGRFEELVARYGCRCDVGECEAQPSAHPDFEEDLSYWEMEQGGPF